MKPLISVVIPTGKDDLRLRWCLEGLARQSNRTFETIVVNDGGPNAAATVAVIQSCVVRLPYLGGVKSLYLAPQSSEYRVCAARNLGAQHARGELIVFLDNDIVCDPNIMADFATAFLRRQGRLELYYCQRRRYPARKVKPYEGSFLHTRLIPDCEPSRFHRANFYTFCVGVPTAPFLACGGFDTGYHGYGGEDADLKFRLARWGYETVDISTEDGEHGWVTHLDHDVRNWNVTDFDSDHYRELLARTSVVRNDGPLESLVK